MIKENFIYLQVQERLNTLNFKGRMVSIEYLKQLKSEIDRLHFLGFLDEKFYRERLTDFDYFNSQSYLTMLSIIIIAAPQPALKVTFDFEARKYDTIIPPTYSYDTDQRIYDNLNDLLQKNGYHLVRAKLPVKLLAANCGLVKYGKNNITYIEEWGSYHRLVAFYTDAHLEDNNWGEALMLEQCQNCLACIKKCPTEAIDPKRFLIHAEKCLTFLNESEAPFPEWIDPVWYNCLVGCMICQNICPVNKPSIDWFQHIADFSEEETNLILRNTKKDNLPLETRKKLQLINLFDDYNIIPRNLMALINKSRIVS